jgi:hypothetical protein
MKPSCFRVPFATAVLALVISAVPGRAAMLPGSETKEWPANPAKHVVSIKRVSANEAEAKLIAAAEGLQHEGISPAPATPGEPRIEAPPKNQWWHQEELGIKIPFAITGEAVTYYSELVAGYGKTAMKRYSEPNSNFSYEVRVAKLAEFSIEGKVFKDVSVVTMEMKFNENFAATVTEGLGFEKSRTVVFDGAGKVLHVSGDGPTGTQILAI